MADGSEVAIEMQVVVSTFTEESSSPLPPSPSPVLAKPDISLHQAAREGRLDDVQKWMAVDKSTVDARDEKGFTAFHYGAQHHHLNMMELLVDNGAEPKQRIRGIHLTHCTALHLAAGAESKYKPGEQNSQAVKDTMQFLVDKGLDINVNRGGFEKSVLYFAWSSGNKAAVEFLLDQKNQSNGNSVLHDACTTSNVELLKLLLEELKKRCQLSDMLAAKNLDRQTPLHVALAGRHLAMVNKLLEFATNNEYAGVRFHPYLVLDYSEGRESDAIIEFLESAYTIQNISAESDRVTILHLAAERGWVRAAEAIAVTEPGLLNKEDKHGRTALHYAAAKNNCETVDILMKQEGADVDAADNDGCTPLLVAAREGSTEAFAKLLERADLEKTEEEGRNAVLLAAGADHSAILEAVEEKYPDFLKLLWNGFTPLHAAAESGSEKSAKVLLERHPNVNARNENKQTPLHLAASNGLNGVVKMLLAYEPPSGVETDEQLATVNVSAGDHRFNTALHLAAEGGHCSVADTLLSKGAYIRTRNEDRQTPLHLAAGRGHQEMVELLVSKHHAEGYHRWSSYLV